MQGPLQQREVGCAPEYQQRERVAVKVICAIAPHSLLYDRLCQDMNEVLLVSKALRYPSPQQDETPSRRKHSEAR